MTNKPNESRRPNMTREDYLLEYITQLRPLFWEQSIALPDNLRVSCGWPRAQGRKGSHAIGQCFARQASRDTTSEIFISPVLDDAVDVGAVLVHELIHAWDDCRHGHHGPFRKAALAVGLQGKMRFTTAGPELKERLNALRSHLGPYPHASLDSSQQAGKQKTRLVKVVCDRSGCNYCFWTRRLHLDRGIPTCVCESRMSEIARRW
jgi:hypothetical protein